jgi:hypothetical protein
MSPLPTREHLPCLQGNVSLAYEGRPPLPTRDSCPQKKFYKETAIYSRKDYIFAGETNINMNDPIK